VKDNVYDVVVLDEVESYREIWADEKTHHPPKGRSNLVSNWKNFKRVCAGAKNVLLMDAFPLHSTCLFYSSFCGGPVCHTIGSEIPAARREVNEFVGSNHWNENVENWKVKIIEKLKAGGNVFIYYPWKQDAKNDSWVGMEKFAKTLSHTCGIPECQYKVYHADCDDADKKGLGAVNDIWSKLRFVVSNSTITVGVNFDHMNHFTDIFTWYSGLFSTRQVIQNIGRIRDNIPINMVYSPNIFGHSGFVTPEDLSYDPNYKTLMAGYKAEYFSKGKTIFKAMAKQANFRFSTCTDEIDTMEMEKMRKVEKETECLFRWDLIINLDEAAFKVVEEKVKYQEASFADHLAYRKHHFKTFFKKDTDPNIIGGFWDGRQINTISLVRDIEYGREPELRKMFDDDYGIPQVPTWDPSEAELKNLMERVHIQSKVDKTKVSNDLVSRLLKAFFGTDLWVPSYDVTKEGKRAPKFVTVNGKVSQEYAGTDALRWIKLYIDHGDLFVRNSKEVVNCIDW
jgi:hypothetical protein